MKSIIRFIIIIIQRLHKLWILEIQYPKIYPSGKIRSLVFPEIIKNSLGLFIEEEVAIKDRNIRIGQYTYIGNNTQIDSCKSIGAYCSISAGVKIGMRNHPLNYISTSPVFYSSYRGWIVKTTFNDNWDKSVIIEDDVLISANVVILNGIKLGRGCIVGAGAGVTRDVPPYAIVAGIPARIIRYRFSQELISEIEKSAWWEKDKSILIDAIPFANNPERFISIINKS